MAQNNSRTNQRIRDTSRLQQSQHERNPLGGARQAFHRLLATVARSHGFPQECLLPPANCCELQVHSALSSGASIEVQPDVVSWLCYLRSVLRPASEPHGLLSAGLLPLWRSQGHQQSQALMYWQAPRSDHAARSNSLLRGVVDAQRPLQSPLLNSINLEKTRRELGHNPRACKPRPS